MMTLAGLSVFALLIIGTLSLPEILVFEEDWPMPAIAKLLLGLQEPSHMLLFYQKDLDGADTLAKELSSGADLTLLQLEDDFEEIRRVLFSSSYRKTTRYVILLANTRTVLALFDYVRAKSLESPTTRWFVLNSSSGLEEHLPPLLREGSSVALCLPCLSCGGSQKYKLLTTTTDVQGEAFFVEVGSCAPEGKSLTPSCQLRSPLFQNHGTFYRDFKGRHLLTTAVDNWPFFKVNMLPNGTAVAGGGMDVSVLDTLATKLNFTYSLTTPTDGQWGVPLGNGSISGMIGQVARYEVDIAIDEITITGPREEVVDFTRPYFLESTTFITQAPQEKSRAYTLVRPFALEVWLVLVATVLVVGPLMSIFTSAAHTITQDNLGQLPELGLEEDTEKRYKSKIYSLETYAFSMYRIFVNQGSHLRTFWPSSRFFLATWYLFCITIYALYAGSVTSFLALPAFEEPLQSLQDLVDAHAQRGFQASLLKASSHEAIFKNADGGLLHDVWLTTSSEVFVDSPTEGVSGVLKNKYAYIHATMALKIRAVKLFLLLFFFHQFGQRKFHLARETFYPQGYGVVCRSGSPYKATLEDVLIRISEAGLVNKWAKDELDAIQEGTDEEEEETAGTVAITLEHLQAAFILMVLGGSSAGFILVLEILLAWLKKDAFSSESSSGRMS